MLLDILDLNEVLACISRAGVSYVVAVDADCRQIFGLLIISGVVSVAVTHRAVLTDSAFALLFQIKQILQSVGEAAFCVDGTKGAKVSGAFAAVHLVMVLPDLCRHLFAVWRQSVCMFWKLVLDETGYLVVVVITCLNVGHRRGFWSDRIHA